MLAAGPVLAGPSDDAAKALDREEYRTTYRRIKPLAEQGDPYSEYLLGVMYENGRGVAQDFSEAATWYRRSAQQGIPEAQAGLGRMYASGRGVPRDYVRAHMWLQLAVSRYPATEAVERERAAENLELLGSKMTPAQIAEAQRMAREWNATEKRR